MSDPRHSEFLKLSSAKFHSMAARLTEKRDKNNRILRLGRPMQFDLPMFRAWIEGHLGPDGQGVARCAYCKVQVSLQTFQADHIDPLVAGGSATLENLAIACPTCNMIKSAMSLADFHILLDAFKRMTARGVKSVSGRLEKSEKLASMVRRGMARQNNFHRVPPQPATVDDNW